MLIECPRGYLLIEGTGSGSVDKSIASAKECEDACSENEDCQVITSFPKYETLP